MRARSLRVGAALATSLFVAGLAGAAGPGWNEAIVGVETHRMVGEPGTGWLWTAEATRTNVFYVGEQIVIHCLTRTTKVHPSKDFQYKFEFLRLAPGASTPQVLLSSESVASKAPKNSPVINQTVRIVEIQTAKVAGSQQFGCRMFADDDDPKDNGPKWQQVTVLPKQEGLAGVFPVPAPEIVHPAPGHKFTPNPKAPLQLKLRVPVTPFAGKPNLVDYAKASAETEKWQLEIVRLGQGTSKGFETTVGKFEGKLDAAEFSTEPLTWNWFEKAGGAGRYAARARLVQVAAGSQKLEYAGPSARVEFEIVAPVMLDAKAAAPAQAAPPAGGAPKWGAVNVPAPGAMPPRPTNARIAPPGAAAGMTMGTPARARADAHRR